MSDEFDLACSYWEQGRLRPAFRLFLRAAKRGDPSAQLDLAHFYSVGLGVRRNRQKEMRWLQKSARLECAAAANNIGVVLRTRGKTRKALSWFLKAGRLGDGGAFYEAGKLLAGSGAGTDEAIHYLKLAISSESICDADMENATQLLDQFVTESPGRTRRVQ
ncbi:MAG: sel1 repeat family protein [Sterolibacteriaceae bacterium]|nr:sel1 repeat family protein [Candidatus Methylophosphatis haderslevensis]